MLKALSFIGAAVIALSATGAMAAAPATADDCNKLSFALADKAQKKKLADADALKVEELLAKLDGQCAKSSFAEAEGTAKEIEAIVSK